MCLSEKWYLIVSLICSIGYLKQEELLPCFGWLRFWQKAGKIQLYFKLSFNSVFRTVTVLVFTFLANAIKYLARESLRKYQKNSPGSGRTLKHVWWLALDLNLGRVDGWLPKNLILAFESLLRSLLLLRKQCSHSGSHFLSTLCVPETVHVNTQCWMRHSLMTSRKVGLKRIDRKKGGMGRQTYKEIKV